MKEIDSGLGCILSVIAIGLLVYWWTGLASLGEHAPCDLYSFRHVHLSSRVVWWIDR